MGHLRRNNIVLLGITKKYLFVVLGVLCLLTGIGLMVTLFFQMRSTGINQYPLLTEPRNDARAEVHEHGYPKKQR